MASACQVIGDEGESWSCLRGCHFGASTKTVLTECGGRGPMGEEEFHEEESSLSLGLQSKEN